MGEVANFTKIRIDQRSIVEIEAGEYEEQEFVIPKAINSIQSTIFPHNGYQILINEDLSKKIEKMNRPDRKRIHKVLYDLQWGYWELGIHVKKLAGIKYPVFEARMDRSRRLLFLIRSIPLKDQSKQSPALILEDIVKHKHITKGAEHILQVERYNQQNYNMALIGEIEQDTEIKSVKELENMSQIISLTDIFEEKIINETDDQKNMTGLPNGIKYFRFDEDVREYWIGNDEIKQYLALSPYQQQIVYKHGPLLINGGAGTGKTTVLAHLFLFYTEQKQYKMFYITLTRSLKQFIKNIIRSMSMGSVEYNERITTFDEVCKKIIGSDELYFKEDNHIDVFDFLRWFKEYDQYHEFDGLQIWQEYYGIIKGNFSEYKPGIMQLKEYLEVSSKESLFNTDDREKIYELIRKYNFFRRQAKEWDSIDLAQLHLIKY